MTSDRPTSTREIRPLTGLRVPVMFAVLLLHSNLMNGYLQPVIGPRMPLFFILSGFVIALAYFPSRDRALPFRPFVVRRVARLWPMLVVSTLLIAWPYFRIPVLRDLHDGVAGPAFYRSILQTAAITLFPPLYATGLDAPMPNGYAWFAYVELSVGLLLPFFAWMAWRLPRYALWAWALLLPASAHAWRMFVEPNLWVGMVWPIGRIRLADVPIAWAMLLALGVLLYRLQRQVIDSPRTATLLARLATPLFVVVMWMTFGDPAWTQGGMGPLAVYLLLGVMIVALSLDRAGLATWALSTPPLNWLGKRSYSLYLMSMPVMKYFLPWAAKTLGVPEWHTNLPIGLPVMLACVFAAGIAAYQFIERPMRNWLAARLA